MSDDPFYISTEWDHAHVCHKCGGTWLHQSEECEWDGKQTSYIESEMTCPGCDMGSEWDCYNGDMPK
jgi:hypothetical protein